MGRSLTEAFAQQCKLGSAVDRVTHVLDLMHAGEQKQASLKMKELTPDELTQLRTKLAQEQIGSDDTPGAVPPPAAKEVRSETTPSTTTGPSDGNGDQPPTGSANPSVQITPPAADLTVDDLLRGIEQITRTPEGQAKMGALVKKATREGVMMAVDQLSTLVQKKGSMNMASRYGEAYNKVASLVGRAAADEVILKQASEGQRQALAAIHSGEEVKMGSLRDLIEGQEKVASAEDLAAFVRQLAFNDTMQKVAMLKAAEEALVAEDTGEGSVEGEPTDAEIEAAAADLAATAIENPEALSDDEAELLMQLADATEDAELADVEGDVEKVSTVLDWAAALRALGY